MIAEMWGHLQVQSLSELDNLVLKPAWSAHRATRLGASSRRWDLIIFYSTGHYRANQVPAATCSKENNNDMERHGL